MRITVVIFSKLKFFSLAELAPKPIQSSSCDVRVSACVSVLFPLSKKQYSEHESSFSKETEVLKDIFKIFGEIQRVRDS